MNFQKLKTILTSRLNPWVPSVDITSMKQPVISTAYLMQRYQDYIDSQPSFTVRVGHCDYECTFRLADYPDIGQMIDLESRAYQGVLAWRQQDFVKDFKGNPYRFYILLTTTDEETHEERAIGLVSGRFLARNAHLSHLMIDPDFQGRGAGKRLLVLWLDVMTQLGIPYCDLEVRLSNQLAIELYEQMGFKKIARLRSYYHDNREDAWKMRLYVDKD